MAYFRNSFAGDMLSEFRNRYPTGSLISELLTIYHGKFVVRVMVVLDGQTRATGLAAADSIELAEDEARHRALVSLGIPLHSGNPDPPPVEIESSLSRSREPTIAHAVESDVEASLSASVSILPDANLPTPVSLSQHSSPTPDPDLAAQEWWDAQQRATEFPQREWDEENEAEIAPVSEGEDHGRQTQPREVTAPLPLFAASTDFVAIENPVDLSDAIAKIDVLLEDLNWREEHQRDYLMRTYAQESLSQLSADQLMNFQQYLETFAQTSQEIKRLGWTAERGKSHLMKTYGQPSRQFLCADELADFLEYLKLL